MRDEPAELSFTLTPVQQGMLFHHLRWPGSGFDIQQIVCALPDPVEAARFRAAWQEVCGRHAMLRTAFAWQGQPAPTQSVVDRIEAPIDVRTWPDVTAAERERGVEHFLAEDRQRGFDPAVAPLFRITVINAADDAIVVFTMHHLILDGRSVATLFEEAFGIYDALREGRAIAPDVVRPTFAAYVHHRDTRDLATEEAFWRGFLHGWPGPTPLVVDRFPSSEAGAPPARGGVTRELSAEASARVWEVGSADGGTVNTLVQAAWALVLARYSGSDDVVFGVIRACREGRRWSHLVGMTINTVPMRVRLPQDMLVREWLHAIRQDWVSMRGHERAALVDIQRWSGIAGAPFFATLFMFDVHSVGAAMRQLGGAWASRSVHVVQQTTYPITVVVSAGPPVVLRIEYDRHRIDEATAERMLGHMVAALEALVTGQDRPIRELSILSGAERDLMLNVWNRREPPAADAPDIHQQIEAQARRTPEAVAVVFEAERLTCRELDRRASRLAAHLVALGATPDATVGICVRRSADMLVGLLGILKAGAAYLPLDPEYPADRLRYMVEDSGTRILVGHRDALARLGAVAARQVFVDDEASWASDTRVAPAASSLDQLAYVIYTSGSTGWPKGVMLTRRNVVSFMAAMDERIGTDRPSSWLAVTSLSFDISVLELLWTLARGFTVVVHDGRQPARGVRPTAASARRPMEFSLFYFSSDEGQDPADRYRLLLAGARFADERGFTAVWTPERHFHAFGGLYANPSVVSAALAVATSRVQIRAGSVVLPLHHPARVAEEWAIVDNLSHGRVGVSFASGWQPDDFVLNPSAFADSKKIMLRHIDVVRRLWRGEAVSFDGPRGPVETRTLPRPVQPELPVWITTAGNPETFTAAGEAGASVLTHLLGQSVEELETKLAAYRAAWRDAGHSGDGHVTLMLHTFVGESDAEVREIVREPMKRYLASSISLIKSVASSFPAFRGRNTLAPGDVDALVNGLGPEDLDALTEHAFNRYYETGGLFGTVDRCQAMVEALRQIGVEEIACLIDFGVPSDTVLGALERLDGLRQRASRPEPGRAADESVAAQIVRHGVTHMQCTPSLASMLVSDPEARAALTRLECLLVGGEALPPVLARELRAIVPGRLVNMYGPTETTVWSSTHAIVRPAIAADLPDVAIGRPLANTAMYVLDEGRRPVPIGVPGELHIGGEGVAAGYFERPELTADRFIADPFSARVGDRLYRTGDLVRYRADGVLEYLGRLDHQVKLRGHRIELGEIEAAMAGDATIGEVVVVAREETPGDVRLVGYVTSRAPAAVDVVQLRARLHARLPDFMVPADVVTLDALPRTPNGKIDRKALPPPATARRSRIAASRRPESDVERSVAAVWCEVLGLPSVGLDENFFDLGGHSLLTVQVRERLRHAAGLSIGVTDMFQFPTVASLARHLQSEAAPPAALDRAQARASRRLAMRRNAAADPVATRSS